MAAQRKEDEYDRVLFGERMVKSGLLTKKQREKVAKVQTQLKIAGKWKRFGVIAVEQGFCSANDIETMPGFLGQKMIDVGILTPEQNLKLVEWQNSLRNSGYPTRYGDLAISEGLCTQDQVEELFED